MNVSFDTSEMMTQASTTFNGLSSIAVVISGVAIGLGLLYKIPTLVKRIGG